MNKILIAVFDSEDAAKAGLQALRRLHAEGELTLYATGVMIKDANGVITVNTPLQEQPIGAAIGLAVGSMIGLLGGPVGLAVGAVTGTVAGAVRDFWVAGVGLDFIDEAEKFMKPGKAALVAEIEEDWVNPVDAALEDAGAHVFRRSRAEAAQAWLSQDISTFKSEMDALESEVDRATGDTRERLQSKLKAASIRHESAVHRARQWAETLQQEAEVKAELLLAQLSQAEHHVKGKIEARARYVSEGYRTRGAKLSKAWGLVKEALVT